MSATAGWYRDPTGTHSIRYWDGQQWTDQANSGGSNVVDPVTDQVRYVQPAPGTEIQPAAAAAQQPQLQVTQQAPRSSGGTVVAVVLSVVAVLLVLVVLFTQNGDDATDTTEPVTTEAPATTEAPSDG